MSGGRRRPGVTRVTARRNRGQACSRMCDVNPLLLRMRQTPCRSSDGNVRQCIAIRLPRDLYGRSVGFLLRSAPPLSAEEARVLARCSAQNCPPRLPFRGDYTTVWLLSHRRGPVTSAREVHTYSSCNGQISLLAKQAGVFHGAIENASPVPEGCAVRASIASERRAGFGQLPTGRRSERYREPLVGRRQNGMKNRAFRLLTSRFGRPGGRRRKHPPAGRCICGIVPPVMARTATKRASRRHFCIPSREISAGVIFVPAERAMLGVDDSARSDLPSIVEWPDEYEGCGLASG